MSVRSKLVKMAAAYLATPQGRARARRAVAKARQVVSDPATRARVDRAVAGVRRTRG